MNERHDAGPATPAAATHDATAEPAPRFVMATAVRAVLKVGLILAIPTCVALVAVPNYIDFRGRAVSSEAKSTLRHLARSSSVPMWEGAWSAATAPDVPITASTPRYDYFRSGLDESPAVFVARGRAKFGAENDVWAVFADGPPENCFDGFGTVTVKKNQGGSPVCRRAFAILGVDPRTLVHRDGSTDDEP
jgi:hypothetical protein